MRRDFWSWFIFETDWERIFNRDGRRASEGSRRYRFRIQAEEHMTGIVASLVFSELARPEFSSSTPCASALIYTFKLHGGLAVQYGFAGRISRRTEKFVPGFRTKGN